MLKKKVATIFCHLIAKHLPASYNVGGYVHFLEGNVPAQCLTPMVKW